MSNEKAEQLHSEMAERSNKRMDSWTRREERREVYMLVAKSMLDTQRFAARMDDFVVVAEDTAEAIYQGMIQFCGEAK